MQRLLVVMTAATLLTTGCTSTDRPATDGSSTTQIDPPSIHSEGSAITVDVDASHTLAVEVPGLGRITAPSGTFSRAGHIVVQKLASKSSRASLVIADGPGIDVTFHGTSILSPLTIYFDDPSVKNLIPRNAAPVVLHKPDDSGWEALNVDYTADGVPYIVTKDFSPNILSWIPLPQWVTDIPQTISNFVSGTAEQRPCVGGGPSWSSATPTSYLVYECMITNTDSAGVPRAELQIQNAREHPEWIQVPSGADYVWVNGQPDIVRSVIAHVTGHDASKYVLLFPGDWMSIGFRQPSSAVEKSFLVEQDDWSFALSVAQAFVGEVPTGSGWTALLVLAAQCKLEGNKTAADYFVCFATEGFKDLQDPRKAAAAATQILGDTAYDSDYSATLSSLQGKLQSVGRVVSAGLLVEAFHVILIPVLDAIVTLQSPSNETFALHLAAVTVSNPAPPVSVAPPATTPQPPPAVAPPPAPPTSLPTAWVTRDGDSITYHWQDMPAGMWSQVDRFRCWRYGKTTHPGGWATDGCGQVTGYSGYPSGSGSVLFTYAGAQDSFSVEPWKYGPWLGVGETCQVGGTPAC